MSTRYNNGSHYENHQRAKELQDGAEHAHRTGEQHGQQEHLTGHEHTRQSLEHGSATHPHAWESAADGHAGFGHDDIVALARKLWHARGCPLGSPDQDWFEAVKELRSRALAR